MTLEQHINLVIWRMTKFKKLKRVKCKSDDILKLNLRDKDKCLNVEAMEILLNNGVAYSYFDGDRLIGCAGIAKITDNVCEVWAVIDKDVKRYTREIYYYARSLLNAAQDFFERIQTTIRIDYLLEIHFMERLGYQREGTLRKYRADGDYYMYAKIR